MNLSAPTECIWPECVLEPYHADDGVIVCLRHFTELGGKFLAEMRHDRVVAAKRTTTAPEAEAEADREWRERKMRRQQALKDQVQVYYVRIGDRIKIGYSTNIRERMKSLRVPLTALLATEPGGRELERMRHLEFAGLRDGRREEFFPHDRLLRHVSMIKETFGPPKVTGYPHVR